MKFIQCILLSLFPIVCAQLTQPIHDAVAATKGLIARRLGIAYLDQFELKHLNRSTSEFDVVHISALNNKIYLEGSCAVAMSYGLQIYLKQVVHTQTDWEDHELHLPPVLPLPQSPINLKRETKYTYYLNVCTLSYSLWTWSWSKWEKHIDWMALNGVNMPLAFTGQEKVWQATFAHFNVTNLDSFFAGAAFLAWGRMGNVQGSWVRGPLPQEFIDDQYEIQRKILARMIDYGMIPALPAFAGHVPSAIATTYPSAKVVQSEEWAGFKPPYTKVYLVDPTDPLFMEIGSTFMREYQRLYGYTAHLYQTDTYNEMDPRESTVEYLRAASSSVLKSMQLVDPKAVWLMQGWLFKFSKFWTIDRMDSYLSAIPYDQLIILDLYTDVEPQWKKSKNYLNHQWIYCLLHNFGGSVGMRGDLGTIASDPIQSRDESNGTMIGIGLTMEGIFQNYILYDLALQMAWEKKPVNVSTYVSTFAHARYHSNASELLQVWSILEKSVYNFHKPFGGVTRNVICGRPRWHLEQNIFMPTAIEHDPNMIIEAWLLMLQQPLLDRSSYLHDLVDITRQAMSDGIMKHYVAMEKMALYNQATPDQLEDFILKFLERIKDLDELLLSHEDFILGKWIGDARALGNGNIQVEDYLEYEARNQVTRWGDNNGNLLSDYAGKEWGGLVGTYYYTRWKIFLNGVLSSYKENLILDMYQIKDEYERYELKWQLETKTFSSKSNGNSFEISKKLYEKYIGKKPPIQKQNFIEKNKQKNIPIYTKKKDEKKYIDICLLDCLW